MAKKNKSQSVVSTDVQPVPSNCPSEFGKKPEKILPQCMACVVDEACQKATHPESEKTCPSLWGFGHYPGPYAIVCETCQNRAECILATDKVRLLYDNLYQFLKDVAAIQVQDLLWWEFVSRVNEWTSTDVGFVLPMPYEMIRKVQVRVEENYDHFYSLYIDSDYTEGCQHPYAACLAARDTVKDFEPKIPKWIEDNKLRILQDIAKRAMSTFHVEDDDDDSY